MHQKMEFSPARAGGLRGNSAASSDPLKNSTLRKWYAQNRIPDPHGNNKKPEICPGDGLPADL